jgi:hypothetical protein
LEGKISNPRMGNEAATAASALLRLNARNAITHDIDNPNNARRAIAATNLPGGGVKPETDDVADPDHHKTRDSVPNRV